VGSDRSFESVANPSVQTVIKGGHVISDLSEAGAPGVNPADVAIEHGQISALGPDLPTQNARVIDARGCIVIPGLVNAHFHSSELFVRGWYDGLAFDRWGLYVYPYLTTPPISPRAIYLRTALAAIEMAENGVTSVTDDVAAEVSGQSLETLEAIFAAYRDVGLRANISGNVMDQSQDAGWLLPATAAAGFRREVSSQPFPTVGEYRAFCREAIRRFHRPQELQRYVVAPVAPQWCTPEMMSAAAEICAEHELNLHTHVLETRAQELLSRTWPEGGFVPYLRKLDALTERTTLAHAIWLSDADLDLIAGSGAAIVHNPVANLRLGVGVAPVVSMLKRGITVGLGTDGIALQDCPSLFEAGRTAVLLSRSRSDQPEAWLSASDALTAATIGGAASSCAAGVIGRIAPGQEADLVVLRDHALATEEEQDPRIRLLFRASARWVETVIVGGQIIVTGGNASRVDANALRAELAEYAPEWAHAQRAVEERHAKLARFVDEMHRS
jgi:5-methylthioadenosine/S-adenosylhomocysteine deaminase